MVLLRGRWAGDLSAVSPADPSGRSVAALCPADPTASLRAEPVRGRLGPLHWKRFGDRQERPALIAVRARPRQVAVEDVPSVAD